MRFSLLILTLVFLAVVFFFEITGNPICQTDACSLTSSILTIPNYILYVLGISGVIILSVLAYIKQEELYKILLFSLISAEAVLISTLFWKTGGICVTCFIFFSLLVLLGFISSFLKTVVFSSAMFIVSGFLNTTTPVLKEGFNLIGLETCAHCMEVKEKMISSKKDFNEINAGDLKEFLSFVGINEIPVLVIKEGKDVKIVTQKSVMLQLIEPFKDFSHILDEACGVDVPICTGE